MKRIAPGEANTYIALTKSDIDRITQPGDAGKEALFDLQTQKHLLLTNDRFTLYNPFTELDRKGGKLPQPHALTAFELRDHLKKREAESLQYSSGPRPWPELRFSDYLLQPFLCRGSFAMISASFCSFAFAKGVITATTPSPKSG